MDTFLRVFAHLNPHSSNFGDICALYSAFLYQLTALDLLSGCETTKNHVAEAHRWRLSVHGSTRKLLTLFQCHGFVNPPPPLYNIPN